MSFDKSVFINCPFDSTYNAMMHSMIFTVVLLGYKPRLALECSDAGRARLEKIIDIIKESRISIHDLSKLKSENKDEFARMNMPFELGLDFGCRKYSDNNALIRKKFLILGGERYEYMKALSDLSGIDIQYHKYEEEKLIKSIRDWFVINERLTNILSPVQIWNRFMDFNFYYYETLLAKGYSKDQLYDLPINEQIEYMIIFLSDK
ncbi:MAG: hypothetical protein CVU95_15435 [Firmicutes bacterium HGW-Firmicutes-2]|nr:MAG: hypothetical protein CVU95_15435 [Firmicutes bacterium HGW-Firmicutes-2]